MNTSDPSTSTGKVSFNHFTRTSTICFHPAQQAFGHSIIRLVTPGIAAELRGEIGSRAAPVWGDVFKLTIVLRSGEAKKRGSL
jgi:hypothetical protein